jgi:hypothetical protein
MTQRAVCPQHRGTGADRPLRGTFRHGEDTGVEEYEVSSSEPPAHAARTARARDLVAAGDTLREQGGETAHAGKVDPTSGFPAEAPVDNRTGERPGLTTNPVMGR